MSDTELVLLKNYATSYEREMVAGLLASNNIPCIYREKGSGQYTDIVMSRSEWGYDLLVNKLDYERALELLPDEEADDDFSKLAKEEGKRKTRVARIVIWVSIAVTFLATGIALFFGMRGYRL